MKNYPLPSEVADNLEDDLRRFGAQPREGSSFAALTADLLVLVGGYKDHASVESIEKAGRIAQWYSDVAEHLEALAALVERRPNGAVMSELPLCTSDNLAQLRHAAARARVDARLHKIENKPHRPAWPNQVRDWLAQETKKAFERHCERVRPKKLRPIIVAVFNLAGVKDFPNPDHDGDKFDAMLSPRAVDEEVRARVAAERLKRIEDKSF